MPLIYDPMTLALHQYICSELDIDPESSLEFVRQYCDTKRLGGQRHLTQVEASVRLNPLSNAYTRMRINTHKSGWFEQLCTDAGAKDFVALPEGRSIRHMSRTELAGARDIVAIPVEADPAHQVGARFAQPAAAYMPLAAPAEEYSPLREKARQEYVRSHLQGLGHRLGALIADAHDYATIRSLVRANGLLEESERYISEHLSRLSAEEQSELAQQVHAKVKAATVAHKDQIKAYKDIRARLHAPLPQPVTSAYDDGFSDDEDEGEMLEPVAVTDQERHILAGEAGFFADRFAEAMGSSHAIRSQIGGHYYQMRDRNGNVYTVYKHSHHRKGTGKSKGKSRSSAARALDMRSEAVPASSIRDPRSGAISRDWPAGRPAPDNRTRSRRARRNWEEQAISSSVSPAASTPSAVGTLIDTTPAVSATPSAGSTPISSLTGNLPGLVPEASAELKVGTHMRLNARRGLHRVATQQGAAADDDVPALVDSTPAPAPAPAPAVSAPAIAAPSASKRLAQLTSADLSAVPDLTERMPAELTPSAVEAVARTVAIDSSLILSAGANREYLEIKLRDRMPAYNFCQEQLAASANAGTTVGAVMDLTRFSDTTTSIAELTVPFTEEVNSSVMAGDLTLMSVEGEDVLYLF